MRKFINPFAEKAPIGPLFSSPAIKRYEKNPVLTHNDVPYPADLAFNAGCVKFNGRYIMAFRYDVFNERNRKKGLADTGTGLAESYDGLHWSCHEKPANFYYHGEKISWVHDTRLCVLENELYISFCFNTVYGPRPGIAKWIKDDDFEVICLAPPAQRNMILFENKINGKYYRLERPYPGYDKMSIWLSSSEDLIHWGETELLLGVEDVPFATLKIGGASSPILTEKGLLLFFHAVDCDPSREIEYEFPPDKWSSRYTCGAVLLDKDDPYKVIAMTPNPILVPEMSYETGNTKIFWRENVIFPCGAIVENDEKIRLYYGAGDYSTCMAEIALEDLWKELKPYTRKSPRASISPGDLKNGYYGWENSK